MLEWRCTYVWINIGVITITDEITGTTARLASQLDT